MQNTLAKDIATTVVLYAIGFFGAVAIIDGVERLADRIESRRATKRQRLNEPGTIDGEYEVIK